MSELNKTKDILQRIKNSKVIINVFSLSQSMLLGIIYLPLSWYSYEGCW